MTEHQVVSYDNMTTDDLQVLVDEYAEKGWTLLAHGVRRGLRTTQHYLTFGRPDPA